MPRSTFPCDVRNAYDRQEARQAEHEIPHPNVERLLPPVALDLLKFDFDKLMGAVELVHHRAPSWVLARLEGLTNVEIAQEWGVSPTYITNWFDLYGLHVQAVFAEYLGMPSTSTKVRWPKPPIKASYVPEVKKLRVPEVKRPFFVPEVKRPFVPEVKKSLVPEVKRPLVPKVKKLRGEIVASAVAKLREINKKRREALAA